MPIRVTCPACKSVSDAPDDYAGKRARCRSCGVSVEIPSGMDLITPDPVELPAIEVEEEDFEEPEPVRTPLVTVSPPAWREGAETISHRNAQADLRDEAGPGAARILLYIIAWLSPFIAFTLAVGEVRHGAEVSVPAAWICFVIAIAGLACSGPATRQRNESQ